jgi:predicted small lipoprotein YifL
MVDGFGKYNSVMLRTSRILVRAISHAAPAVIGAAVLLGLSACGQPGPLYLPTEPAAANRATLPQSMWPIMPEKSKPAAPSAPAAATAPVPNQAPAAITQPAPASTAPQ